MFSHVWRDRVSTSLTISDEIPLAAPFFLPVAQNHQF